VGIISDIIDKLLLHGKAGRSSISTRKSDIKGKGREDTSSSAKQEAPERAKRATVTKYSGETAVPIKVFKNADGVAWVHQIVNPNVFYNDLRLAKRIRE